MHYLRNTDRAQVRVVYPDLALTSADGARAVLVTHGHYMERVGTLFSAMARMADPSIPPLDDVDLDRARELGLGRFLLGVHGALDTDRRHDREALRLDAGSARRLGHARRSGLERHQTIRVAWLAKLESWGIRRVVGRIVASKLHERERNQTDEVLGEGSRRGLTAYLAAMRHTFAREWDRPLPGDVTMVVGHTHKPFSEWWDEARLAGGGCASSTPAAGWSTTWRRNRSWAVPSCS